MVDQAMHDNAEIHLVAQLHITGDMDLRWETPYTEWTHHAWNIGDRELGRDRCDKLDKVVPQPILVDDEIEELRLHLTCLGLSWILN